MNSNTKLVMVELDKIIPAPYNPDNRTTPAALEKLKRSINNAGILVPLIINSDFELVDGHRRLECARQLDIKTVPCIIHNGNREELFMEVNSTSRKLSRADDLFVYLSGGKVDGPSSKDIEYLERLLGRAVLESMAENKQSPKSVLSAAAMLFGMLHIADWRKSSDPFVKRAILWIIENKQIFAVRWAASSRIASNILMACVENNTPVR